MSQLRQNGAFCLQNQLCSPSGETCLSVGIRNGSQVHNVGLETVLCAAIGCRSTDRTCTDDLKLVCPKGGIADCGYITALQDQGNAAIAAVHISGKQQIGTGHDLNGQCRNLVAVLLLYPDITDIQNGSGLNAVDQVDLFQLQVHTRPVADHKVGQIPVVIDPNHACGISRVGQNGQAAHIVVVQVCQLDNAVYHHTHIGYTGKVLIQAGEADGSVFIDIHIDVACAAQVDITVDGNSTGAGHLAVLCHGCVRGQGLQEDLGDPTGNCLVGLTQVFADEGDLTQSTGNGCIEGIHYTGDITHDGIGGCGGIPVDDGLVPDIGCFCRDGDGLTGNGGTGVHRDGGRCRALDGRGCKNVTGKAHDLRIGSCMEHHVGSRGFHNQGIDAADVSVIHNDIQIIVCRDHRFCKGLTVCCTGVGSGKAVEILVQVSGNAGVLTGYRNLISAAAKGDQQSFIGSDLCSALVVACKCAHVAVCVGTHITVAQCGNAQIAEHGENLRTVIHSDGGIAGQAGACQRTCTCCNHTAAAHGGAGVQLGHIGGSDDAHITVAGLYLCALTDYSLRSSGNRNDGLCLSVGNQTGCGYIRLGGHIGLGVGNDGHIVSGLDVGIGADTCLGLLATDNDSGLGYITGKGADAAGVQRNRTGNRIHGCGAGIPVGADGAAQGHLGLMLDHLNQEVIAADAGQRDIGGFTLACTCRQVSQSGGGDGNIFQIRGDLTAGTGVGMGTDIVDGGSCGNHLAAHQAHAGVGQCCRGDKLGSLCLGTDADTAGSHIRAAADVCRGGQAAVAAANGRSGDNHIQCNCADDRIGSLCQSLDRQIIGLCQDGHCLAGGLDRHRLCDPGSIADRTVSIGILNVCRCQGNACTAVGAQFGLCQCVVGIGIHGNCTAGYNGTGALDIGILNHCHSGISQVDTHAADADGNLGTIHISLCLASVSGNCDGDIPRIHQAAAGDACVGCGGGQSTCLIGVATDRAHCDAAGRLGRLGFRSCQISVGNGNVADIDSCIGAIQFCLEVALRGGIHDHNTCAVTGQTCCRLSKACLCIGVSSCQNLQVRTGQCFTAEAGTADIGVVSGICQSRCGVCGKGCTGDAYGCCAQFGNCAVLGAAAGLILIGSHLHLAWCIDAAAGGICLLVCTEGGIYHTDENLSAADADGGSGDGCGGLSNAVADDVDADIACILVGGLQIASDGSGFIGCTGGGVGAIVHAGHCRDSHLRLLGNCTGLRLVIAADIHSCCGDVAVLRGGGKSAVGIGIDDHSADVHKADACAGHIGTGACIGLGIGINLQVGSQVHDAATDHCLVGCSHVGSQGIGFDTHQTCADTLGAEAAQLCNCTFLAAVVELRLHTYGSGSHIGTGKLCGLVGIYGSGQHIDCHIRAADLHALLSNACKGRCRAVIQD